MSNISKFRLLKRLFAVVIISAMLTSGVLIFNNTEVRASEPSFYSWRQISGSWYYYKNATRLKDSWARDSHGWCYLSTLDGSLIKDGWAQDSQGWCYIGLDGYWVDHATVAQDSLGYCIIGENGYWTGNRQDNNVLSIVDVAKNAPAIVYIEAMDRENNIYVSASGCIVSSDGRVITNYHVAYSAYSVRVTLQDGTQYEVEAVLGYSKEKDIAILKLKNASNLAAVKLGDSDRLQLGEQIVTIGNPGGYMGTVSEGIISGLHRINFDLRQGEDIQISAPIANGSSGGGLFNMSGQIVGITYAGNLGSGNLNFVIPINEVKPLLEINRMTTFESMELQNP